MEKKMVGASILFLLIVVAFPLVYAHGEENDEIIENIWFYLAPFITIILGVLLVHYYETTAPKKKYQNTKKIVFILIVVITSFVALAIFYTTVQINITSWTKGPVHWHADVEIEICGEHYFLPTAEGLSNKIGTNLVHTHEDMRIHIEGPVMEPEDASLEKFFVTQGIPFSQTQIADKKNGDLCPDGKPGRVKMLVNGVENTEFENHIIAPYPDVPPGDMISIIFGAD